jgi:hypothetical protein
MVDNCPDGKGLKRKGKGKGMVPKGQRFCPEKEKATLKPKQYR